MKPKVLIVDDDPLIHVLYKGHLERAGYELLGAKDGAEALQVAAKSLPDVIVMDIMMRGMDGLSALRALKKADATRNIPVIIITANLGALIETRRETENSGASGFLPKPFSPSQLLAEVQRLVPAPEKPGP